MIQCSISAVIFLIFSLNYKETGVCACISETMNPAATPTSVDDVQHDGRWMSMVSCTT